LAGPEGYGLLSSGVRMAAALHPDSDGQMGRVQAVDLEQLAFTWRHRQTSPVVSSLLATAGGLVFAGDMDRWLTAFDDRSGERLWQTRLDAVPSSTIVTYAIDGRQYVALVVGQSNYHVNDWARVYDLLIEEEGLAVDEPAEGSAGIWVFALE
jgi:alcohol dehydrogenase (cytochrome c)